MSMSESGKSIEQDLADIIKNYARVHGEIPSLRTISHRSESPHKGRFSNASLYRLFARYGDDSRPGGIADFAHAVGATPAVIVDGTVYSPYTNPVKLADSIDEEINSSAATAPFDLEKMPTGDLIQLLGKIAVVLQQRNGPNPET